MICLTEDFGAGLLWRRQVISQNDKRLALTFAPGKRRDGEQRCNRICRTRYSKNGGIIHFLHCDIRSLTGVAPKS